MQTVFRRKTGEEKNVVKPGPIKINKLEDVIRFWLTQILLDDDRCLLDALNEVVPNDNSIDLGLALVQFFSANNRLLSLLKWSISKEFERTKEFSTLFRGTSLATKLWAAFCKQKECIDYLKVLVEPLIRDIQNREANLESYTEDQHIQLVTNLAKNLINQTIETKDQCPEYFRYILKYVKSEVESKFPGSSEAILGGFFFLRFVCPTIVSPHNFGLVEKPPASQAQRVLIQVSKIIQNLANALGSDVLSKKMDEITPMKSATVTFIERNKIIVKDFFKQLTEVDDSHVEQPTPKRRSRNVELNDADKKGATTLDNSLIVIMEIIVNNKEKIYDYCSKFRVKDTDKTWDRYLEETLFYSQEKKEEAPKKDGRSFFGSMRRRKEKEESQAGISEIKSRSMTSIDEKNLSDIKTDFDKERQKHKQMIMEKVEDFEKYLSQYLTSKNIQGIEEKLADAKKKVKTLKKEKKELEADLKKEREARELLEAQIKELQRQNEEAKSTIKRVPSKQHEKESKELMQHLSTYSFSDSEEENSTAVRKIPSRPKNPDTNGT